MVFLIEHLNCGHLNNLAKEDRVSGFCPFCKTEQTISKVYNQNSQLIKDYTNGRNR